MLVHITRDAKARLFFLILSWPSYTASYLTHCISSVGLRFSLSRRKQDCILCLSFVRFSAKELTCVLRAFIEVLQTFPLSPSLMLSATCNELRIELICFILYALWNIDEKLLRRIFITLVVIILWKVCEYVFY